MTQKRIFVYGCYGYTGTLIVKEAIKQKIGVILGGRDAPKCRKLAESVGINPNETIIFSLNNEQEVQKSLENLPDDVVAVMNVAGPYSETFDVMVRACLKNKLHYLDVAGEVEVFEKCIKIDEQAREAKISLVPGCGFDVVPSDCMASYLQKKLPDATHLDLAFLTGESTVSHGTMKTITTHFGKSMLERKDNTLQEKAYEYIEVPFKSPVYTPNQGYSNNLLNANLISSGDISTSQQATKIPNIRAFMASERTGDDQMFYFLSFKFTRFMMGNMPNFLKNKIIPEQGPSTQELENTNSWVQGKAWNEQNKKVEARLKLCSAYKFTALAAVEVMKRFSKSIGISEKSYGFQTPSMLFGEKFVSEIDSKFVFEDIV